MSGNQWWNSDVFAVRKPLLLKRAAILTGLRAFFAREGFVEVETPSLQICPGTEQHIKALETTLHEPLSGGEQKLYLHTSPEIAMKKLLVAGMDKIFQISHVWRDGERSLLHHPEFTMLEWYRLDDNYETLMNDCQEILVEACRAADCQRIIRQERSCDPEVSPHRMSVPEAIFDYCGIDILESLADPYQPDRQMLAHQMDKKGFFFSENDQWEDLFFRLMMEKVEPNLPDATFLCDYPLPLAASARPLAADHRLAERFEFYVCGVELANGFGELTDAAENLRRFRSDMKLKEKNYGEAFPEDEDFFSALARGMRPCSGIALGFDRLVMLASGVQTIDEILWVPVTLPLTSVD